MDDDNGTLYLFAIFSALIWTLWVIKVLLSGRYRPWTLSFATTATVLVPVVDEPLDLFDEVLRRITAQQPYEVIVVINGPRNPGLEKVCDARGVDWVWTPVASKRHAIKVGTERATGEVLVLVDSDTIWTEATLPELLKPFADPRVGGVTTRQRILDPDRCWITRWADWLENSRALYSMPAQSVLGQVGCLPGRTIAFRRQIVSDVMHDFMTQRFLGVFLEVSDDRTLTNLALKQGYRTVYQYTSLVYTDAPTQWRKLSKQQLRWARGSQYNTLRMLPWMLAHAPMLAFFFVADIVLPFLLLGAVIGGVLRWHNGTGVNYYAGFLQHYGVEHGVVMVVALTLVASGLSMSIRQMRHLQEKPTDALRMPGFVVMSTLFLMPIRLLGFFRMAHASGWGTRANAYEGGDLLSATTPGPAAPSAPPSGGEPAPRPAPVLVGAMTGADAQASAHASAAEWSAPSSLGEGSDPVALPLRPCTTVLAQRPAAPPSPAINLLALLPYLIGSAVIALEVLLSV